MMEEETIMVRAFLMFLGVSLVIMGAFLLMSGLVLSRGEVGEGGFVVVIGPFFLAYGENVPPHLTALLILVSIGFMLLIIYLIRRWFGGHLWEG